MQSDYPLTRQFTKLVNTSTECLSRVVVSETVNVPVEIWMTFTFTLVIAAFLVAGGVYLVYNGTTNNVTDFVVLGSCGTFVGFCFGSVGIIILYKSVCGSHKQISWKNTLTLVRRQKNKMMLSCTDVPARPLKVQINNQSASTMNSPDTRQTQPAGHKKNMLASTVNSPDTRQNQPAGNKKNMSANKVYGNGSIKPPPVCVKSNQPVILGQTDGRRECAVTDTDCTMFNQGMVKKGDIKQEPISVKKGDINQEDIYSRYVVLPRYRSLTSISSQSTSSELSTDSAGTFEESVTVVVAEVHAQPAYSRDSFEYINEMHQEEHTLHESPLPIYLSVSYDENAFDILEEVIAGDKSSRPDTGVGESISEEDIPFAYDDQESIYSLNTPDSENCDDPIARLLISDPLMYGHSSDVRHSYILNNCHVITEVLVNSG